MLTIRSIIRCKILGFNYNAVTPTRNEEQAMLGTDKETYIRYWVYVIRLGVCMSMSFASANAPGNIVIGIDRK